MLLRLTAHDPVVAGVQVTLPHTTDLTLGINTQGGIEGIEADCVLARVHQVLAVAPPSLLSFPSPIA